MKSVARAKIKSSQNLSICKLNKISILAESANTEMKYVDTAKIKSSWYLSVSKLSKISKLMQIFQLLTSPEVLNALKLDDILSTKNTIILNKIANKIRNETPIKVRERKRKWKRKSLRRKRTMWQKNCDEPVAKNAL